MQNGRRRRGGKSKSAPPPPTPIDRYFLRRHNKTSAELSDGASDMSLDNTGSKAGEALNVQPNKELKSSTDGEQSKEPDSSAQTHGKTDKEPKTLSEKEPSMSDLQNLMQNLHADLCKKLEGVRSGLEGEIRGLKEQCSQIDETVKEHSNTLTFVSNKIEDIEQQKIPDLENRLSKKIASLETQLVYQEMRSRKYNLIFHGVKTGPAKTSYDYSEVLYTFFADKMKIDQTIVDSMIIANAHPVPYDNDIYPIPPVIAKFARMCDRDLVLSNAFKLKETPYKIVTDLPKVMKDERYKLAREAFKLRKEGFLTRIRTSGLNVIGEYKEKGEHTKWIKM